MQGAHAFERWRHSFADRADLLWAPGMKCASAGRVGRARYFTFQDDFRRRACWSGSGSGTADMSASV